MQNKSHNIKESGLLAELVYADKYINGSRGIINSTDHAELTSTYTVLATRDMPSGFQGMFLEELDSGGHGTGNYVFAFRGTEGEAWKTDFPEFFKDLFIADIAYMGTGHVPQQMKDAMAFINEVMHDDNLNVSLNAGNTTFTGHSLGGNRKTEAGIQDGGRRRDGGWNVPARQLCKMTENPWEAMVFQALVKVWIIKVLHFAFRRHFWYYHLQPFAA